MVEHDVSHGERVRHGTPRRENTSGRQPGATGRAAAGGAAAGGQRTALGKSANARGSGPVAAAGRTQRRQRRSFAVVAILPFVLFGLLFTVYPLAQVARMAGSDVRIHGGRFAWRWTGLENLRGVLADGAAWSALANTLVFIASSVSLSVIIGLALALLVDRSVSLLRLARNVLIWPAVIAPVVVSLMWLLILSPTAGGLNKLLRTVSLPEQGWLGDGGTAMAAIVAVDVWHWTPVVFLLLYTALKTIDTSTLEAARIDGATESQVIRRIVLPALRRAIGGVIVIRVIMGVKAFDEMYVLTHGGPDGATTLVSQHIKSLFFDNLELGAAAAFSLAVVVVTAIALGVFLFVRSKAEK